GLTAALESFQSLRRDDETRPAARCGGGVDGVQLAATNPGADLVRAYTIPPCHVTYSEPTLTRRGSSVAAGHGPVRHVSSPPAGSAGGAKGGAAAPPPPLLRPC